MVEELQSAPAARTPGIVLFVAILNFIGAAFSALVATLSLVILIFGNVMGMYELVTRQLTQYYPETNVSFGVTMLFGIVLTASAVFAVFYLYVGTGLLKAKKPAWYISIATAVIGLLGFPFWTAVNVVILVFFFQPRVRDYFQV